MISEEQQAEDPLMDYRKITAEESALIDSINASFRNVVMIKKNGTSLCMRDINLELGHIKSIFHRTVLLMPISDPQIELLQQINQIARIYSLVTDLFTQPSNPKGLGARPAWQESCKCEEETECTMCGLFKRKFQYLLSMHRRMVYVFLAVQNKFKTMRSEVIWEIQEFIFDRNTLVPSLLNRCKNIRLKKVNQNY